MHFNLLFSVWNHDSFLRTGPQLQNLLESLASPSAKA